jgi:hypothetical protein
MLIRVQTWLQLDTHNLISGPIYWSREGPSGTLNSSHTWDDGVLRTACCYIVSHTVIGRAGMMHRQEGSFLICTLVLQLAGFWSVCVSCSAVMLDVGCTHWCYKRMLLLLGPLILTQYLMTRTLHRCGNSSFTFSLETARLTKWSFIFENLRLVRSVPVFKLKALCYMLIQIL